MLNAAQVHLAVNHFPIAGIFLTVLFLFLGIVTKMKSLLFSGMLLAILSGLAIIPMNLSGEGAEEIVEHKNGVTEALIHAHEEFAEKAIVVFELTAVFAFFWFVAREKKESWMKKIELLTLIFAIISCVLIANTAHTGGMIRHEEIRPNV
jgi:uncharacterized membrane protein